MRKIIVATDFSKASMNAADFALHMATQMNAELILLHVYSVPLSAPESFVVVTPDEVKSLSDQYLKKEIIRLNAIMNWPVRYISAEGNLSAKILQITNGDTDAILITGKKTEIQSIEKIFGNTHTALLNKMRIPMLVVPENFRFVGIKRWVLALEYLQDIEMSMIQLIHDLGIRFESKLFVMKVMEPSDPIMDELNFRSALISSKFKELDVEYVFPRSSNPAEAIMNFIANQSIQLLIVQSHKHHFLDNLLNRSEARKLVFQSAIPVLLFPPLQTAKTEPFQTLHQQHS